MKRIEYIPMFSIITRRFRQVAAALFLGFLWNPGFVLSAWDSPYAPILPPESVTTRQFYGVSIDISGDWIIVGSFGENTKGRNAGAAYMYRYHAEAQEFLYDSTLFGGDTEARDRFGFAVAISGTTAVVGA